MRTLLVWAEPIRQTFSGALSAYVDAFVKLFKQLEISKITITSPLQKFFTFENYGFRQDRELVVEGSKITIMSKKKPKTNFTFTPNHWAHTLSEC